MPAGRGGKQAVEAEEKALQEQAALAENEVRSGEEADEEDPVEKANREAAEAIDLETLDETSDYTVFMKKGVPAALKRQAMSALWRSNPVLANVDGLVEYGEDYANPDLIMKTFKSAWQAGRGYVEHQERLAREAAAKETPKTPPEDPEEIDDPTEIEAEMEIVEAAPAAEITAPVQASIPNPEPEYEEATIPRVSLRRRLMLDDET